MLKTQPPIKALKIAFITAVSFLVALTVASHFILKTQITNNESTARIINTSGFLRTASQRIALLGRNLSSNSNPTERENIRQEILYEARRMEIATNGLLMGDVAMGLPSSHSAVVDDIFYSEPILLNRKLTEFVEQARALATTREMELGPDNPHLKYIRKHASGNKFLADLDMLVQQYQVESEDSLRRLRAIALLIAACQIAIVLFLAVFIFAPLARQVQNQIDDLSSRNGTLEKSVVEKTQLALLDPLTELLNRRGLQQALNREIMSQAGDGQDHVVLIVDLDDFKFINDHFSHAVGDEVLIEVGQILKKTLPAKNAVCRIGGDEFIILLPKTSINEALVQAEIVRVDIENAKIATLERSGVRISASIGLITLSNSITSVDELLRMTHSALYKSKTGGKNRVSYEIATPRAC
jgi:diguanylate cyclase (GGDEF)-like protein